MEKEPTPDIIKPDGMVYTIYKYAKLDSTNGFLKQHCSSLSDYSVIWANEQTHGRGRFTRVWNSVPGQDLTFSLLLPLTSLEHKLRQNITQREMSGKAFMEYRDLLLANLDNVDSLKGLWKLGSVPKLLSLDE